LQTPCVVAALPAASPPIERNRLFYTEHSKVSDVSGARRPKC